MNVNYTGKPRNACKVSYGKESQLFGLAPELTDKDKIYTKDFVDNRLCDMDDPLLLVSSDPFNSIPNEIELRNALACFTKFIFHPDKNQIDRQRKEQNPNRKNTEYTAEEIRDKLTNFVEKYLNRDPESLKRQKIVSECARAADPIDMLSECKTNCMWSEYKTATGNLVFFPHVVLNQLNLLKESIKDDLSFVNSILKDSGKVRLAQLHKFRGKDARKDNLRKLGDDSKAIAAKLKGKYGARGQQVKTDAGAVANRLKKQRKKKVQDLFALIQNKDTGGVNKGQKNTSQ